MLNQIEGSPFCCHRRKNQQANNLAHDSLTNQRNLTVCDEYDSFELSQNFLLMRWGLFFSENTHKKLRKKNLQVKDRIELLFAYDTSADNFASSNKN